MPTPKIALITGGAKRLGAKMVTALHEDGFNVAIHYRHSKQEAEKLADQLNQVRPDSVITIQADLNNFNAYQNIIAAVKTQWGRLDVLINNASEYFPTPLQTATEEEWNQLSNSNTKAPYFLIQAALPLLNEANGCVINLSDMNTFSHKPNYSIYCVAKSGINVITHMLAKELAPNVRVNAIAPSTTIPPENQKNPPQNRVNVKDVINALRNLIQKDVTGKIICLNAEKT